MRARTWLLVPAIALVALAPAPPAAAQVDCRQAVAELCPGISPGTPELRSCVRTNAGKLPAECRARLLPPRSQLTAGMEALRKSCGAEIDQHCDEVQRGGGRLLRCLRALDEEKTGESCRAYLDMLAAVRAAQEAKAAEDQAEER